MNMIEIPVKFNDAWRLTQCWQRGQFAKLLGRSNAAAEVGTLSLRHGNIAK